MRPPGGGEPGTEEPGGGGPGRGEAGPGRDDAPSAADGPFPASFRRFVELVNGGEFWDSHEVLEDAWRETGSEFYHGLILYASAFVHARRDNAHGVAAQLEKACAALIPYRPAYHGLDVNALLRHAGRCRELVQAHREDPPLPWEEILPRPRLEPDPELVRGDEPELEGRSEAR